MNTNNNRPQNNNNRRRGRNNNNNNRQQNNNRSGFDYNNAIDNRARGNAAQMLEKYKKLAQDAQFNDDRVNAEYHLQFADHYFRVLADFRSRQEARNEQQGERRPREEGRDDWQNEDRAQGYYEQGSNENAEAETSDDNNGDNAGSSEREERPSQRDERPAQRSANNEDRRPRRNDRGDRPERSANDRPNSERPGNDRPGNDRGANRAPRRHHSEEETDASASLDIAVLPPSIAIAPDFGDTEAEAKPARKARARKPKLANDEDVATAAE
jgi:Domain of unknown function (DUF4167)